MLIVAMSKNNLTTTVCTQDRSQWNAFITQALTGHLMQSYEWGVFKAATGWRVYRITVERDNKIVAGAQLLIRPLPFNHLTVAYIPKGPVVDFHDSDVVITLLEAIHRVARQNRAIFLKIEPNLLDDDDVRSTLLKQGFRVSPLSNNPRSTMEVDLSQGEEAVLRNMRRKTRQLVQRAAREGVQVVPGGTDDLKDFYHILKSAGTRKEFPVHKIEFYAKAWQTFREINAVELLLAKCEGQTVGAKMIFVFGDSSMHFWGGTLPEGQSKFASYLLQREALNWAIAHNCKSCDLWGIPDQVGEMLKKQEEIPTDRSDGLWGVYLFKRGFGGEIKYYLGAYDYVYSSPLYWLGNKLLAGNETVDNISRWIEQLETGLTSLRRGRSQP